MSLSVLLVAPVRAESMSFLHEIETLEDEIFALIKTVNHFQISCDDSVCLKFLLFGRYRMQKEMLFTMPWSMV